MNKELTLAEFKAYCESFVKINYLFESKCGLPCVVIGNRYKSAVFAVLKNAIHFHSQTGEMTLCDIQKIEIGPVIEDYYQKFTVTCRSRKGQIKHKMMLTF